MLTLFIILAALTTGIPATAASPAGTDVEALDRAAHHPKIQGAFLRDSLGAGGVSVGLTFGRGSLDATGGTTT